MGRASRRTLWAAMCVLVLVSGAERVLAQAADPRPAVVVLGDQHAHSAGLDPSWAQLLAIGHADWNVYIAGNLGLIPEVPGKLDAALEKAPVAGAVIVLLGRDDTAKEAMAKADAAKIEASFKELLQKLKANPKTAKAKLFLCTPIPVVDARLDKWSKEKYAGGEAAAAALAEAARKAAQAEGAEVIDVYKKAFDDKDDKGTPGKILGSTGFTMRGWAHPILLGYIEPDFVAKAALQPADAAAFEAWKKEQEAHAALDQILSSTSEGVVQRGAKLVAEEGKANKVQQFTIKVPAEQLSGGALNILIEADSAPFAIVTPGTEAGAQAQPKLVVETDGGKVEILSPSMEWQCLNEAEPDRAMPTGKYAFDTAGKRRYFAVSCKEEGKRLWTLMRFPLQALDGKKATGGTITMIGSMGGITGLQGPFGNIAAHTVAGSDVNWCPLRATWKTRDGKLGWTGGAVKSAERKTALEAFLATQPPAPVAARAKEELAKLK